MRSFEELEKEFDAVILNMSAEELESLLNEIFQPENDITETLNETNNE